MNSGTLLQHLQEKNLMGQQLNRVQEAQNHPVVDIQRQI
tara:strand:+ start:536 stop:652 length:117 start_codon:yes stop_codon:yes gene_type:complete